MKAATIKKEIHKAVDSIDDKLFLQSVYLLLNEKTKEFEYELTKEEKRELDALHKLHKSGKSKSFTMEEVRKYAHSKLRK